MHGSGRNRRDPSAHAWRRARDRTYKPMVKSSGGQRESERGVVPLIGVQHNAPGGKGPHFDHVRDGGKHEGMAGTARPNYPDGPCPVVVDGHASVRKVRKLQRGLWAAAKQSPERRFHALYDRIHRGDVLWEAWERVRVNRGSAGVDRVTLQGCFKVPVVVGSRRSRWCDVCQPSRLVRNEAPVGAGDLPSRPAEPELRCAVSLPASV